MYIRNSVLPCDITWPSYMTCKCLKWHLLTANPVTLVTDRLGLKVRSQRSGGFVPRAVCCNLIGSWPRWCTHHRKLNYRDCHPESHTAHLSCLHPPSLHSSSHLLLCFASLLHLFMSSLVCFVVLYHCFSLLRMEKKGVGWNCVKRHYCCL